MKLQSFFRLHSRLLFAVLVGVALAVCVPFIFPFADSGWTRVIIGWDGALVVYLALVWRIMAETEPQKIKSRAREEDEGAFIVLLFTVISALASVFAIFAELHGMQNNDTKPLRLIIVACTIFLSWFFVHTVYALHYAREYYSPDAGNRIREGLAFSGKEAPDYWDFLYFSFTIGATSQTSDVGVASSSFRRVVLCHSVFSFFFNTSILALIVNIGAGLI